MTRHTWFVVADGARGRIFEQTRGSAHLEPALPYDLVESRLPTRERVTDRGGQTLERHGKGGHSKWKAHDAKAHGQQELARRIADELRRARAENRFEELVLVMPPAFLGLLRKELDDDTNRRVVATHAKELSALTVHDLERALHQIEAR